MFKGVRKILDSATSLMSLAGMFILGSLAYHQGVEATQAVAYPIFLLAGGVAAARAYQQIKVPKGGQDEKTN